MNSQELSKAIGAHGMWKQRLNAAIEQGSSSFSPEQVAPDNQCDFGRWLYSLPPVVRRSPEFNNVQALHASFHKEAARVLSLAVKGDRQAARQSMDIGGTYSKVSSDLTSAMMTWKKKLDETPGGTARAAA